MVPLYEQASKYTPISTTKEVIFNFQEHALYILTTTVFDVICKTVTAVTSSGKQCMNLINNNIPNTIAGATVSPSTFNLLESVHSLLLACHATTRNLKKANCWFRIHCEVQEQ